MNVDEHVQDVSTGKHIQKMGRCVPGCLCEDPRPAGHCRELETRHRHCPARRRNQAPRVEFVNVQPMAFIVAAIPAGPPRVRVASL